MSGYDDLLRRCCDAAVGRFNISREAAVASILAEVLRTLENVTPDMVQAAFGPGYMPGEVGAASAKADFLAMLRASPLVRP